MINIEIESARIQAELQNLQRLTTHLSPVLRAIGEQMQESTKRRFERGVGPDDVRWLLNTPATLEHKEGDKPLVDHGALMDTISYEVHGDTLTVYSPMEYAAMMQFGGTKDRFPHLWGDIPARPFLGVSREDEDMIVSTIRLAIDLAISGA